jgi:hypothetical protein
VPPLFHVFSTGAGPYGERSGFRPVVAREVAEDRHETVFQRGRAARGAQGAPPGLPPALGTLIAHAGPGNDQPPGKRLFFRRTPYARYRPIDGCPGGSR